MSARYAIRDVIPPEETAWFSGTLRYRPRTFQVKDPGLLAKLDQLADSRETCHSWARTETVAGPLYFYEQDCNDVGPWPESCLHFQSKSRSIACRGQWLPATRQVSAVSGG